MLEASLDAGLGRQLKVLGQQLLLSVVLLLDVLQLATQNLRLVVIATPLRLQLALQQPAAEGGERKEFVKFRKWEFQSVTESLKGTSQRTATSKETKRERPRGRQGERKSFSVYSSRRSCSTFLFLWTLHVTREVSSIACLYEVFFHTQRKNTQLLIVLT